MVELKALKMIQAKNYKHLAFDIDIGESSETGQAHSSTHKLYWAMPLQLCVCVCGGDVPQIWSQFRGGSAGWGEWSMLFKKRGRQGPSGEREIEKLKRRLGCLGDTPQQQLGWESLGLSLKTEMRCSLDSL